MAKNNFYKELEDNLILYDFLISKIGTNKERFEKEILPTLNQFQIDDFIKSPQQTKYFEYLTDLGLTIDPKYDKAIVDYTYKIRNASEERKNLSLKYFQYLSLLFTEIYLNLLQEDKNSLLKELNQFLKDNKDKYKNLSLFEEKDLYRLAYWMATGSGKTIIMHYNYFQVKKYFKNFNKILVITPNEGLSYQHYEEFKKSGINATFYNGNKNILSENFDVLVIDINKLRVQGEKVSKDDKGKTIFVDEFGTDNILFVDEGHKGKKSEEGTWERRRSKLSEKGFIVEYSATFGQVANKENIDTFGKSIIFNYSYKKFYQDGFGKDFKIFNIENKSNFSERDKELILTANLLSFYQQLKAFEENRIKALEYNVEKPLWAVLGSKVVSGKSKEAKETLSDIAFFIQFLKKSLEEESFLKENIKTILNGKSGFLDKQGNDVFEEHFKDLTNTEINQLLTDLYKKVFTDKGKLELFHIKNSDGEIGLKIKDKYFGVINVGDVETLKKNLKNLLNIEEIQIDEFSSPLFPQVKNEFSNINIVIGAKKFIEGWDTWRVSSMGLIHIGKGEGSQIIQLFGRCVRLKGKNYSLKREPEEIRKKEKWLDLLQTAYIFGIGSDYLKNFLETINTEIPEYKEIKISTILENTEKWNGKLLAVDYEEKNISNEIIEVFYESNIAKKVKINLIPKLQSIHGSSITENLKSEKNISPQIAEYSNFLNWNELLKEIINYKIQTNRQNLVISTKTLKKIIQNQEYKIISNKILSINSLEDLEKVRDLVLRVLKAYIDKFYNEYKNKQLRKNQIPIFINKDHLNIVKEISIKIPEEIYKKYENDFLKLEEYLKLKKDNDILPFLYFNLHLYNPIPIEKLEGEDLIKTVPVKLNEGETRFIKELREFLKSSKELRNKKVYIVRNLPKIGIGFYEEEGYYPDFILWLIERDTQHIVFIDPKGLRFTENKIEDNHKLYFNIVKTKVYEKLLNEKLKENGIDLNIKLHGFFISTSESVNIYSNIGKLNQPQLEEIGIYFFDSYNNEYGELFSQTHNKYYYLQKIFERIKIGNELDSYLREILEYAHLEKLYSYEEIQELLEHIDEDITKQFLIYLKLTKILTKFPISIEELLLNFVYFYLELPKTKQILQKKLKEIKEILEEQGYSEEKIEHILRFFEKFPYILNVFLIYYYYPTLLTPFIEDYWKKILDKISFLKEEEFENYELSDIEKIKDASERL